ncbi:AraC family transcriptional regulator [Undibacterium sp. TS12]|uniref:helix-turn-helix transcriptional regulator n=1 Tax=Undibacterium sp. TS12 TaxID=2908202 RepID=UPI001F4C53C1|nr:AraC family transcriptional regulator [Undibacterium sp. TS12]MCH8618309.1 AraC family transcriptional regulator [Undibacterium sp. TS12]
MNKTLQKQVAPVLSVQDAVFPAHPFSGLLAIGRERDWHLHSLFPALALNADGFPAQNLRLSYIQAREAFLQARRQGGADLGILSGARKSLPQLGAMASGMRAQESLSQAMQFGLEYQLIAGAMVELVLEPGEKTSVLSARPLFDDVELQDFLDADHLATAINVSRALCGSALQLEKVELRGNRQASRSVGEDFFGCPVSYGADVSRIIVSNSVFDTILPAPDPALAQTSKEICDAELAAIGLSGKQSLLRKLVSLQCENQSVPELASVLGISPRSLHRLLVREGCSYFQLAESLRMEKARHYLRNTSLSLDDIAEQLHYSDSRSFRRAFKRAVNLTPSEFRQQAN